MARLLREGKTVAETPMKYAGQASIFEAAFPGAAPGTYELEIVASDAGAVNFGMAKRELIVPSK